MRQTPSKWGAGTVCLEMTHAKTPLHHADWEGESGQMLTNLCEKKMELSSPTHGLERLTENFAPGKHQNI